jgi:hypothetical protein
MSTVAVMGLANSLKLVQAIVRAPAEQWGGGKLLTFYEYIK